MSDETPVLYLIGGCNGAGKTTFAKRLLPAVGVDLFLNADEIARGLSPLKVELAALRAGKLLLTEADALISQKISFGLESTLSGKTYVRLLEKAKAAGYLISIHFIRVPSADVSIQRVAQRVIKGGHHVPTEDIERRFLRSSENFARLFAPLADRWFLWDNSGDEHQLVTDSESTTLEQLRDLLLP